ncbi:hypothetical protein GCM10010455_18240 [Microbacterium esteraromaticum]
MHVPAVLRPCAPTFPYVHYGTDAQNHSRAGDGESNKGKRYRPLPQHSRHSDKDCIDTDDSKTAWQEVRECNEEHAEKKLTRTKSGRHNGWTRRGRKRKPGMRDV